MPESGAGALATAGRSLLIVSDVDGTLLEGRTLAAPPAVLRADLEALSRAIGAPVMLALASSRTLRELLVLQRALGLPGPCIAEDGAVIARDAHPGDTQSIVRVGTRRLVCTSLAPNAAALRAAVSTLPMVARADVAHQPVDEQSRLGFRTAGARRRALAARTHSLLIDPRVLGADDERRLRAETAAAGLHCQRGGQWLTLTAAIGKGHALGVLRHQLGVTGVTPSVAAIGNEENDESLLLAADVSFVIRNPTRGPHPRLAAIPGATVLDADGPAGWRLMFPLLAARFAPTGSES